QIFSSTIFKLNSVSINFKLHHLGFGELLEKISDQAAVMRCVAQRSGATFCVVYEYSKFYLFQY
ncbi:hypothetical protein KKE25_02905, partial [Patescibacteria group bacterium]|nr:hypothetical protein [Patescibacteria group bacterium]